MSVVAIRLHDTIYMYVQRTKSARYQKNLMQILLKMNFSKCVYKLYILTALTKHKYYRTAYRQYRNLYMVSQSSCSYLGLAKWQL